MSILGNTLLKKRIFPSSFLLDEIPNVIHGYSTRKLSSTYNGYCVEACVGGVNGICSNIGFLNNSLDTTTIFNQVFISGQNTVIPVFYDQVGSAHLVQDTANGQPIIINAAGTLQTAGGQPALSFNNQNLISSSNIPQFPLTIIAVIEITGSTNGAFVKCGDGSSASGVGLGCGNGSFDNPGVGIVGLNEGVIWIEKYGTNISTSEMAIVEVNATGDITNIYLNGGLIQSSRSANPPVNYYYLGGYLAGGEYARFPNCRISENIVFNTVISDTARAMIVANMKDYYGIS